MKTSWAQRLNPATWVIVPLLRALNRRRNPTRDFPPARVARITMGVDVPAPRGLQLGAALRALESLGPADWMDGDTARGALYYYPHGAAIQLVDDRVTSVQVLLQPARSMLGSAYAFHAGCLELLRGGRTLLTLDANTSENALASALGAPRHTERYEDRRELSFVLGDLDLEVEVDASSRRLIMVTVFPRES